MSRCVPRSNAGRRTGDRRHPSGPVRCTGCRGTESGMRRGRRWVGRPEDGGLGGYATRSGQRRSTDGSEKDVLSIQYTSRSGVRSRQRRRSAGDVGCSEGIGEGRELPVRWVRRCPPGEQARHVGARVARSRWRPHGGPAGDAKRRSAAIDGEGRTECIHSTHCTSRSSVGPTPQRRRTPGTVRNTSNIGVYLRPRPRPWALAELRERPGGPGEKRQRRGQRHGGKPRREQSP
jgi:hypothetical protein